LGKKGAAAEQLMWELLEIAAITLDEPLLASVPVESWKKTIETVVGRWKKPRKLILVFDEFQWIVEKSPELPSKPDNYVKCVCAVRCQRAGRTRHRWAVLPRYPVASRLPSSAFETELVRRSRSRFPSEREGPQ
jgi:hypothetical protein